MSEQKNGAAQLELPLFRVIQGGGAKKAQPLKSRDAVVRVLVGAGADLLLRRISPERAAEIEKRVDRLMTLFDHVDAQPRLMPVLERALNELEAFVAESQQQRLRSTR